MTRDESEYADFGGNSKCYLKLALAIQTTDKIL